MEEITEYFCSDCRNSVKEEDVKCPNCGAELTGIIEEDKLSGIEGWLLIPTLWLIIGPILTVLSLLVFIRQFPIAIERGFVFEFVLEIFVNALLLAIMIYTGFHFFQKRKNTPRIVIFWLKVSILLSCILLISEVITSARGLAVENGKQLIRDIFSAIIWIPYFKKSKRVKLTFIK